jgi:hypothetical protein
MDRGSSSEGGATAGNGDDGGRGRDARQPTDIPAKGWKDVLARTRAEIKRDNATLLSAGVAFYSLLALAGARRVGVDVRADRQPGELRHEQVADLFRGDTQPVPDLTVDRGASRVPERLRLVLAEVPGVHREQRRRQQPDQCRDDRSWRTPRPARTVAIGRVAVQHRHRATIIPINRQGPSRHRPMGAAQPQHQHDHRAHPTRRSGCCGIAAFDAAGSVPCGGHCSGTTGNVNRDWLQCAHLFGPTGLSVIGVENRALCCP